MLGKAECLPISRSHCFHYILMTDPWQRPKLLISSGTEGEKDLITREAAPNNLSKNVLSFAFYSQQMVKTPTLRWVKGGERCREGHTFRGMGRMSPWVLTSLTLRASQAIYSRHARHLTVHVCVCVCFKKWEWIIELGGNYDGGIQ